MVGRVCSKHSNAALADSIEFANRSFNLVLIDVASAADDDVLDPPCKINIAPGYVSEVASFQPIAVEKLLGFCFVQVVAPSRRRPRKLQTPLVAIRNLTTGIVDDAYLMSWDQRATGCDLGRIAAVGGNRNCFRFLRQGDAIDPIRKQTAPRSWKRQTDAIFGESINRGGSTRIEPIFCKTLTKCPHRFGAYGFCTVHDHPRGTQIQALNIAVIDTVRTEVECEIRRT